MSSRLCCTKFRSHSALRLGFARCDARVLSASRITNQLSFSRLFTTSSDQSPEYNWVDGAERIEGYAEGGFHPIHIGDVLRNRRYQIVDKLGQGGWSTVWLAHDSRQKEYVALKVGIAESLPHEVEVLRALSKRSQTSSLLAAAGYEATPHVLDDFSLEGPNGSHPCYTTTPALENLREVSFSRLFPLDVSRAFAYELGLAVAYVHSQGYVHGGL